MRKALIAMIIVLIALILAVILFVVGVQMTRENNKKDDKENKENIETVQKTEKDTAEDELKDEDDIPYYETEPEPEKVPEPETKPEPEIDAPGTYSDYAENDNKWYRVRTSAGSEGVQDGAFKSFANAKLHANTLKDKGYKVYDDNMNCIYVP